MNLPHVDRRTVIVGSMFVAPILAAQLAQPLHSFVGKPSTASAGPAIAVAPVDVAPPRKATELELAAARRIDELRRSADAELTSPFYYSPREDDAPAPDQPITEAKRLPDLVINSIVEARDGNILATINGRLCGIGAAPVEGWTVTQIDAGARTVTLTCEANNETLVIKLSR